MTIQESGARSSLQDREATVETVGRTTRLLEVELAELRPNPHQPRKTFAEATIRELADSIARTGLLQPIAVVAVRRTASEDGYTIVAGERRYRALKLLGRETAPALVLTEGSIDELALIENVQREDLHPLEEAEAMAQLMERHGYTQEVLAEVVGKARPTVTNTLRLNTLAPEVNEKCSTSNIATKSLLLEISPLPAKRQLPFWNEVKKSRTTVRASRLRKADKRSRAPFASTFAAGRIF